MPHVVDGVVAHRGGEHRHVFGTDVGATDHRLVLIDPCQDGRRGNVVVAEVPQGPGHGPVDDRHGAAADQALVLDQAEVWLDAGRVAVHKQADGAGGRQHGGLAVPHAHPLGQRASLEPRGTTRGDQLRCNRVVEQLGGLPVHLEHAEHRFAIVFEALERPHPVSHTSRSAVGVTGHERGDRRGHRPTLIAVVGQAKGHEQRTEVGVAQAELAKCPGGLANGLGRIVGVADQDLLGGEHHLDGMEEALHVEPTDGSGVVVWRTEEGQQVEAGQIAGRIVEVHIF